MGDVANPDLVGPSFFSAMDLAVRTSNGTTEAGLASVQLSAAGLDAVLPHGSLDSTTADGSVDCFESGVDARAAIGLVAVREDPADLMQPYLFLDDAATGRPGTPSVVPAPADTEYATHRAHREFFLVVADEDEDVVFRVEVNSMVFLECPARALGARTDV